MRLGAAPEGAAVERFLVEVVEGFTGNHNLGQLDLAVGQRLGEVGVGRLAGLAVAVDGFQQTPNLPEEFVLLGVERRPGKL